MTVGLDRMPITYWDNTTKIDYLQRRIIVYSIMYYKLSESCVTDSYFDQVSQALVNLMQQSTKEDCEKSAYWYAMYDFDGTTGFDIPDRLNKGDKKYLTHIAKHILWLYKSGGVKY